MVPFFLSGNLPWFASGKSPISAENGSDFEEMAKCPIFKSLAGRVRWVENMPLLSERGGRSLSAKLQDAAVHAQREVEVIAFQHIGIHLVKVAEVAVREGVWWTGSESRVRNLDGELGSG